MKPNGQLLYGDQFIFIDKPVDRVSNGEGTLTVGLEREIRGMIAGMENGRHGLAFYKSNSLFTLFTAL